MRGDLVDIKIEELIEDAFSRGILAVEVFDEEYVGVADWFVDPFVVGALLVGIFGAEFITLWIGGALSQKGWMM
jgi:hypothetical protein